MNRSSVQKQGIAWGPFRLRIPFIHTKLVLSELLQGLSVAAATAMALVPLLTTAFGLSFEEAVTMAMIHSILISSAWMIFGEPYCPGWLTPALPLVLLFVLTPAFPTPEEKFQAMTALSLDFAFILIVLGVTGLGEKLVRLVPEVLKAGIILGAALAAFLKVLDFNDQTNVLITQPLASAAALILSLGLAFSEPLKRWAERNHHVAFIASLGLLPGFIIAGLVGLFSGEMQFQIESGFMIPPFADLWAKVSPFSIGWPSFSLMLECMPLAIIAYIMFFGDLVTGDAIINEAAAYRQDDPIEINHTRSHLSVGIRNVLMGIFAPMFPTQGVLWTGVQVVVVNRWREGREAMESLFDGIAAYYVYNIPLLFLVIPLLMLLKPLMGIALLITLVLTGFACANIAMDKARTQAERGVVLLTAVCLSVMEPWQGLLIGVFASLAMVNIGRGQASA